MASEIYLHDPSDLTVDGVLQLRWENTVNTPLIAATWLGNGGAVAGVYTLVVDTSGAAAVNITAQDPKHPWAGTGIPIVADGVTENTDVLPGVGLVFAAGASTGWTSKVAIGAKMDIAGVTARRLDVGIVEAGSASTTRRIAAVNWGDQDSAETKVYALPGFYVSGTGADIFVQYLTNHPDPSRHASAVAGTLTVTFADWHESGGVYYVDVYVDGVKTIEDAKLDGVTDYYYGSANGYVDAVDGLLGLSLTLADTSADPSAITLVIHVLDGYQWVELADDVSGSPGTWGAGPVTLTEDGEADGLVTPSGVAHFHTRMNLPAGAAPGDLRGYTLRVRGLTI